MQKMGDTIITDLGMDLLSSVNNGDDKITYTKTVLAADDLTQESDVDIQKTTSLTLIQQTTGTTVISRVDDTVNLGATFTNKEVTQNFDFYVIGWYAKGSAVITDERLFAITPSTVKQTMPAGKDGAATAAISPKYASALSRSATVSLNPDQAGTVTPEYVDQKIQQIISEGIVNAGSTLSESDNLDSFITTGYHLIKGSLPLSAPEGFSNNGQIIVYGNKDTTDGVTQLAYDDINGTSYVRSYNPTNNKWSDWDLVITKSQLNAVLPTDIARTGEDNDFKGKNTFETDPVDKNGDAYGLAKDIATKVTDNGDNSIEINKQAVTPVRDNKNGSINFNSKDMTPADDSAVVHTTGDETIDGQKKFKTDPTDSAGNAYAKTIDVNQQLDKKVNVADMRKPASDVAGIEEVNAKQDKIGYTPADDSKVAHLSGANNFDTVPTVDNNPLLLASSLPSDLARTGQPQTFTQQQTFSIAPVINDASKDKGDNQAATMADLKSVEADAWHVAESNYPGLLMQVDRDDKIIYILSTGDPTTTRLVDGQSLSIICDLSSYIDRIISASGYITTRDVSTDVGQRYTLDFTGAELLVNSHGDIILGGGGYSVSGDPSVLNNTSAFLKLQYNSWIGK